MLTRLHIRNLKTLQDADIELGQNVVLIGPNNSGKTTALQALALWEIGLRTWSERRKGQNPEKRPGVAINRKDVIAMPVPAANLLWYALHLREMERADGRAENTQNVRIEIEIEGISGGHQWVCGLEFDYTNVESFVCRPLRNSDGKRKPIPDEALQVQTAFLPPMSGLAAIEPKLEPGRINVLIGEGQTAQVLRNLCYQVHQAEDRNLWKHFTQHIHELFGVELLAPEYLSQRGEIQMQYRERDKNCELDLSSSGRGMQQTMLLLAYLYAKPNAVLLLDEPDAHLEILRQRQIYRIITEVARQQNSQVIVASHSEVVLNEAIGRDTVVSFALKPHKIDKAQQLLKALKDIDFADYYRAEQKGWVLYLEGSTDLSALQAFARKLNHPAEAILTDVFVRYVTNSPSDASNHFHGLQDAYPSLIGIGLYDHLGRLPDSSSVLQQMMWQRREIENYFAFPDALLAYAGFEPTLDLFSLDKSEQRKEIMQRLISDHVPPVALRNRKGDWWVNTKASDDFLDRVFRAYFAELELPVLLDKGSYYQLTDFLSPDQIDPEVTEKLDAIVAVAERAQPYSG